MFWGECLQKMSRPSWVLISRFQTSPGVRSLDALEQKVGDVFDGISIHVGEAGVLAQHPGDDLQLNMWQWLKIQELGLHRFWSMCALTRAPFWDRILEPYPCLRRDTQQIGGIWARNPLPGAGLKLNVHGNLGGRGVGPNVKPFVDKPKGEMVYHSSNSLKSLP